MEKRFLACARALKLACEAEKKYMYGDKYCIIYDII
jgi:hypothetical protein